MQALAYGAHTGAPSFEPLPLPYHDPAGEAVLESR